MRAGERSLRGGLLLWLGTALVVLLALDALVSYRTALRFANRVYDAWLVDSTRSLAQAVRVEHGRVSFQVPEVALDIFQFDEIDHTYFKVSSIRQGFLGGEPALPDSGPIAIGGLALKFTRVHGAPIRLVATRLAPAGTGDSVTVAVGETLRKRATLTREILLAMAAPQITLLAIALALVYLGVSRGLKPLTDLAAQIEARDQNNLTPVPVDGLPRETRVLAARINGLLDRLGEAIRAQQRFVADAAHQLRTPLAALLLHAERARRAEDPHSEQAALRALQRSVERAARLSQQLLTLARAEPQGSSTVAMKPVDLVALARRVGEEWIPRALEREADFGLAVPEERVTVSGDEQLLGELLSNLIDNALRYGRPGGSVTVNVESGEQPQLAVQDDGPGVAPEERQRIFERFYRPPGTPGEGCGLGLAIVDEIARLHGAAVTVSAGSDGTGSRFAVIFRAAA